MNKTLPLLFDKLPCGNLAFPQRQINVLLDRKVEPVEIIIQIIFFGEVLIGLTLSYADNCERAFSTSMRSRKKLFCTSDSISVHVSEENGCFSFLH